VLVRVPHESALELREFDVLTVEFANDLRTPVLVERGKFRGE
jgi:hypothetical protein